MSNEVKQETTNTNEENVTTQTAAEERPTSDELSAKVQREIARALLQAQKGLEYVARWLSHRAVAAGALAQKLSAEADPNTSQGPEAYS